MNFFEEHDVISHLKDYGESLILMMNELISAHNLSNSLVIDGLPWLPRYTTIGVNGKRDPELTLLFQQEMARHGVLMRNIIICYRHSANELEMTRNAFEKTLIVYKKALENGVSQYLEENK